jgi:hypothetical protein
MISAIKRCVHAIPASMRCPKAREVQGNMSVFMQ